jgi:hypothetical protein
MLRLFLDNRVIVLLLLPAVLGLYLVSFWLGDPTIFGKVTQVSGILPYLSGLSAGHVAAHFFILLLNAILLNWVFNSREFLEKNTFIVSLNYLIFASFFHTWGEANWLFAAHLFCIAGFGLFFGIKPQQNSKKAAFNASFAFGFSLFFEPSFVVLLPLLLLMFIVLRGFFWRELLLISIGFFLPLGGYLSYAFLTNQSKVLHFFTKLNYYSMNWQELTVLILLGLLFIFSLLGLRARLLKASLKLKKQAQILTLFSFFIFASGLVYFFLSGQVGLLSLSILPFSFYFSYALLSSGLGISSHLFFYVLFVFSLVKFLVFSF